MDDVRENRCPARIDALPEGEKLNEDGNEILGYASGDTFARKR